MHSKNPTLNETYNGILVYNILWRSTLYYIYIISRYSYLQCIIANNIAEMVLHTTKNVFTLQTYK